MKGNILLLLIKFYIHFTKCFILPAHHPEKYSLKFTQYSLKLAYRQAAGIM